MNYIILTAGVLNLFIGFLALRNTERKREMVSFAVFCFITSAWTILNFFLGYFKNPIFLGPIYAFGTLSVASLLSWTYMYIRQGETVWKHFVIYFIAGAIALLSLFTNLIIGNASDISVAGMEVKEGALFPLFGIFLLGCVIFSLIKISLAYRKARGDEKKRKKLVLIGIGGFTIFSLLVSSVLPMFGIFKLTNLDSPSTLIFVVFTFIAIFKYRFLNIKVILAHLLVITMIVFSAAEIFYSQTTTQFILRTIFFFLFLALGVFLVENIVTEIKRKEELEIANAKLKQLDDAKSEFISIASHQLRTPITAIKGFITLILDGDYGEINEGVREAIGDIQQSNQRLMSLVDDLLNVSRIESGKINLCFEKNNVATICQEIIRSFSFRAEEKGLNIKFIETGNVSNIIVDKKTITEAISNIVDNAIKYTNSGTIRIEIADANGHTQIIISDTGIGIAPKHKIHLFSKFSRGDNAMRYDASGTGLGLYVAKSMIENNGGSIQAESDGEGKGSRFIIEIPAHKKAK